MPHTDLQSRWLHTLPCPGAPHLHLSWGDSKQHVSLSKGANWIMYCVLSPHMHTHDLVLAPECPLSSVSPLPRSRCLSLTSCVFCLLCGTLSPQVAFCPLPWCLQVLPNTVSPLHTNLQVANFQGCALACRPLDIRCWAALLCFSRHRACVLSSFSHV